MAHSTINRMREQLREQEKVISVLNDALTSAKSREDFLQARRVELEDRNTELEEKINNQKLYEAQLGDNIHALTTALKEQQMLNGVLKNNR